MCNATKVRDTDARGSAQAASACHCTDSPLRQETALFHLAGRSVSVRPRTGRAGALFLSAFFCIGAWANEDAGTTYPQVWISPGIYSHHFDLSKNLRNENPGPGIEFAAARNHAYQAGSYINSVRARTTYAFYAYRPLALASGQCGTKRRHRLRRVQRLFRISRWRMVHRTLANTLDRRQTHRREYEHHSHDR